jgi:hypothetical protein
MEHWLDFDRREHALLWDLIRYELALTRLSRRPETIATLPVTEPIARRTPRAASVPSICGDVILYEMRCDPRTVAAKLKEKSPRLDEVPMGTFHFCYWRRDRAAEIHILQLDELGFYLLSLADGGHSAAELSRLLGGGKRPPQGLLKALSELAAVGILAFDIARKQAQ